MQSLPLVAILNDAILPGETRPFAEPVVDLSTLKRLRVLAKTKELRVAAVSIASAVEFPSMVTGRWATIAQIAIDGENVSLVGQARARLASVTHPSGGPVAELEEDADKKGDVAPLIAASHRLLAALDGGSRPVDPKFAGNLPGALAPLLRSIVGDVGARALVEATTAEAVTKVADDLVKRGAAVQASCDLEPSLRALAASPELPESLRRQLWSQTVEIQRRLDLFDPDAAESTTELTRLQRRLGQAGLPRVAREVAKTTLKTLRGMPASHHEYSTYLSKLELIASLPWHAMPPRPIDLARVKKALDSGHSGLDKVKKRILEYFAVRMLNGAAGSSVLCLNGPPGVGKTTIVKAIADAMERPFVRIPLGGVHDECEIRGHRQSFTAASVGRILEGFSRCKSNDPVVLLDELDKIGTDRSRSPAAALLEILDPAQNTHFTDNFLAIPYDLSNALFIATTNEMGPLEPALRDRLEPIQIEGYTTAEKVAIVEQHLLDRVQKEHGLPTALSLDKPLLEYLVAGYTREAGVRELQRVLSALCRDAALTIAMSGAMSRSATTDGKAHDEAARAFDRAHVTRVLGPAKYRVKDAAKTLAIGVAQGLATVEGTGQLLRIEAASAPGKGDIVVTGSVGDVMQESVRTTLGHLRSNAAVYGLNDASFARDVFVHAPEAAAPKDGPSAGVAIAIALVSALSGKPASGDVAVTGELSLSGEVLAVGGVRAKILAAERAGIRRVIVPKENADDVPSDVGVRVIFAEILSEAIAAAFEVDEAVAAPPTTNGKAGKQTRRSTATSP